MEIVSRENAKRLGLKRYYTGKRCKYGHVAERWVTGRCVECFKDYYDSNTPKWQQWRNNNLERNKEVSRRNTNKWRLQDPEKMLLSQIRSRCKRNNIPCTITEDDIRFPTHCPILGIELFVGIGKGSQQNSPSVDRIIPGRGYIPGNVQVISKLANSMKNAGTLDDCIRLGEWAKQYKNAHPPIGDGV